MKNPLLILLVLCLFSFNRHVYGQIFYGTNTHDSTIFTFTPTDSLTHRISTWGTFVVDTAVTDSTATRLWQIGSTIKSFFSDSNAQAGIMTDTINEYPINANSWFILTLKRHYPFVNPIISFTHKYQTTTGLDGGIVEFSLDSGVTWENTIGQCGTDVIPPSILTSNFYNTTDTLFTGTPGFSGSSNGWVTSIFQFLWLIPLRTTGSGCDFESASEIKVRFRFISDSVPESLDGWIINNIQVTEDNYPSSVTKINKPSTLSIYPNPSADDIFTFPALDDERNYNIEITNAIGARVMSMPYTHQVNLSGCAKGLYFYRVTNGSEHYAGQLLSE